MNSVLNVLTALIADFENILTEYTFPTLLQVQYSGFLLIPLVGGFLTYTISDGINNLLNKHFRADGFGFNYIPFIHLSRKEKWSIEV